LKENSHDHHPNREETGAEEVKATLQRTATENPELPPAQILRMKLRRVPIGVLAELPERENLKKSLRRIRQKDLPPNPKSLKELGTVPEQYQKTKLREQILKYDSIDRTKDEFLCLLRVGI